MDKRKVEIFIAVLILLSVVLLLWFLLRSDGQEQAPDRHVPETVATDDIFYDDIVPGTVAEPIPEPIARTFVERFASFSTEADFSNVDDVLSIVTPDLRLSLLDVAEKARAEQKDAYYGVSTSIIVMNRTEETDLTAKLAITTQRQESFGSPGNTSNRYQDIVVDLIFDGDDWLVSNFAWQ